MSKVPKSQVWPDAVDGRDTGPSTPRCFLCGAPGTSSFSGNLRTVEDDKVFGPRHEFARLAVSGFACGPHEDGLAGALMQFGGAVSGEGLTAVANADCRDRFHEGLTSGEQVGVAMPGVDEVEVALQCPTCGWRTSSKSEPEDRGDARRYAKTLLACATDERW